MGDFDLDFDCDFDVGCGLAWGEQEPWMAASVRKRPVIRVGWIERMDAVAPADMVDLVRSLDLRFGARGALGRERSGPIGLSRTGAID